MPAPVDKSCQSTVWITPERILEPVRQFFGGCSWLDPATEPDNPTGATVFLCGAGRKDAPSGSARDGLRTQWRLPTFVNPPYGRDFRLWAEKIGYEAKRRGVLILALLPTTRTETGYWQDSLLTDELTGCCLVRRRLQFLRPGGLPARSNPYGSVVYLYNGDWKRFVECFSILGTCVRMEVMK